MLAAIPYTTFPTIELGPLNLRTFGLMVALGVLLGAWIAAAYAERFGITRDETYRVATWMVLAGIVGARLTWVVTHTDQIDSPLDVIAIWQGGIQFAGGFICALVVGLPFFKKWRKVLRWRALDGYALGLSIGLAIGRIGCYSVGEHFGRTTDFFLASRYDGGDVREATLGDVPLVPGTTFHNTSLYELIYMVVLFAVLGGLVLAARRRGRDVAPGTLVGVFVLYYGIARLVSDSFRVNDERVAGMTGAQWMCLVMIPAGIWILWKVRPRLAALVAAESAGDVRSTLGDQAATATVGATEGSEAGEVGATEGSEAATVGATEGSEADDELAPDGGTQPAAPGPDRETADGEAADADVSADEVAAGDVTAADVTAADVTAADVTAADVTAADVAAADAADEATPDGGAADQADAEATVPHAEG